MVLNNGRPSDEESEAVQVIQTLVSHYDPFVSFNEDATVRHPSTTFLSSISLREDHLFYPTLF